MTKTHVVQSVRLVQHSKINHPKPYIDKLNREKVYDLINRCRKHLTAAIPIHH